MNKKAIFISVSLLVLITSINIFAEDIKLISYYPAPFGAYRQLTIGPGVLQPKSDNSITKVRIGVKDETPLDGNKYVKSILEVGGIAEVSKEESIGGIGVYSEEDAGIFGRGNSCGVIGLSVNEKGSSINSYGVYGEAIESISIARKDFPKIYGLYGRALKKENQKTITYGVYGKGKDYGGWFESTDKYAIYGKSEKDWSGYFDGDVKVKGRAELDIPNIPVFQDDSEIKEAIPDPQEGDLVLNWDTGDGTPGLQVYANGRWWDIKIDK